VLFVYTKVFTFRCFGGLIAIKKGIVMNNRITGLGLFSCAFVMLFSSSALAGSWEGRSTYDEFDQRFTYMQANLSRAKGDRSVISIYCTHSKPTDEKKLLISISSPQVYRVSDHYSYDFKYKANGAVTDFDNYGKDSKLKKEKLINTLMHNDEIAIKFAGGYRRAIFKSVGNKEEK